LALNTIMPADEHEDMDLNTEECSDCHYEGADEGSFRDMHSGYDDIVYTADGVRYSEAISVTITEASFDGTKLSVSFVAGESPDLEGVDATMITPTVLVGLYGYDTKDFIIGAHERLIDDNGDGAVDRSDQRVLEFEVGAEHPRMTTVSAEAGSWSVEADLSTWADLIADGTVKRIEIGVLPLLVNEDGVTVALNAPSRTFDLASNSFADDFYPAIGKVENGCNNCHEALATNFHEPSYGGNLTVCRMCHITKSGGSHLEMQSRALDSYIHAIHSGQAFDIAEIDFADPVAAMHYEHHINFPYPTHGTTNCESCHVEGMYNVPDQSMSLPGIVSASAEVTGWDRKIGAVPEFVTGPAATACGGCHRAALINEDNVGELVSLNQHLKQGGYAIPTGEDAAGTLDMVIDEVMSWFK
jgi:OmcA/MtrC family decaheme c-type cytochrome